MSLLGSLASSAWSIRTRLFGRDPDAVPSELKAPIEVFQESLENFSDRGIDKDECVKRCTQSVGDLFQPADWTLSDPSRTTAIIVPHLDAFNEAVDKIPYLVSEAEGLKLLFKASLCRVVEEKWAGFMAQSFYPILLLSSGEEKGVAAQKWTYQYFKGVDYFRELKGYPFIEGGFVATLEKMTLTAFYNCSLEKRQQEMQGMLARLKEPIFAEEVRAAAAKEDTDPTSLSRPEAEAVAFARTLAHYTSCSFNDNWPDIDANLKLLQRCIWQGFTLQSLKQLILSEGDAILGDGTPEHIFANMFRKT